MKKLQPSLIDSLGQVASDKHINAELIMESLKEALVTAARKYTGIHKRFEVDIDEETNEITVALSVEVVEDFPDYPEDATAEEVAKFDEGFMLIDEATDYNEDVEIGDMLEMEIPIEGFGRMAIQTAKQILMQKIRESERQRIMDDYSGRVGTLVSGEVQQVDRGNILVKLGETEAILPAREQIRKERYRQGDSLRALIANVSDNAKGAQVVLSRGDNRFLMELFKLECPEIYDGIVEIKGASRDPGYRAKIAVYSSDEKIDPVGACVGMKGNRVQAIVRELSNERIDIVQFSHDIHTFIRRALAPAEITKLVEVEGTRRVVAVIPDEEVSQAIGKNRQNVKLANQLVNRTLDLYSESEFEGMSEEERQEVLSPREKDLPLTEEELEQAAQNRDKFSELNSLFNDN